MTAPPLPPDSEAPCPTRAPEAASAAAAAADRCRCGLAMPVSSGDLLQGRKSLEIRHAGMLYRLQVTRAGKLILTK